MSSQFIATLHSKHIFWDSWDNIFFQKFQLLQPARTSRPVRVQSVRVQSGPARLGRLLGSFSRKFENTLELRWRLGGTSLWEFGIWTGSWKFGRTKIPIPIPKFPWELEIWTAGPARLLGAESGSGTSYRSAAGIPSNAPFAAASTESVRTERRREARWRLDGLSAERRNSRHWRRAQRRNRFPGPAVQISDSRGNLGIGIGIFARPNFQIPVQISKGSFSAASSQILQVNTRWN